MLVVLLLRKLVGLAVAVLLVVAVVQGAGPALAADSLDRTARAWTAAEAGHPEQATSLTAQLAARWQALAHEVTRARQAVERTVGDLTSG